MFSLCYSNCSPPWALQRSEAFERKLALQALQCHDQSSRTKKKTRQRGLLCVNGYSFLECSWIIGKLPRLVQTRQAKAS